MSIEIKDNREEIRKNKETKPTEVCRVCGSKDVHATYNQPTMSCISFLRSEISRLQELVVMYQNTEGHKKTMRIKVTEEHIKKGKKGNLHFCPVALSIREVTGSNMVEVDADMIVIGNQSYDTPDDTGDFIIKFDEGRRVEPFEFDL